MRANSATSSATRRCPRLISSKASSLLPTALPAQDSASLRTRVSIRDGRWHINDQVTYPGARSEGLLMNVRMVNSVFEDRKRSDFDAEANTERFLTTTH